MNNYIIITTAFDNKEEAVNIRNELLEKQLIACGQINDINSSYYWDGKIETTDEFLLTMKTKKALFKEIESLIKSMHSYEVCELIATDITEISLEYANWIEEVTK